MAQPYDGSGYIAGPAAPPPAALPFLPGYRIQTVPKQRHHKTQAFEIRNGIRGEATREANLLGTRAIPTTTIPPPDALRVTRLPTDYRETLDSKFAGSDTATRLPAWVAYDRKVLRFYAFFKESVASSSLENWRLRKCVLYFYLEDDSIHIGEPKIENSGIPQGVLIKRHRIPKADGSYVAAEDLAIGAELTIYGRTFRIVDADEATRQFYLESGRGLAQPEEYPTDPFTKKHTYRAVTHHKLMNPLKQYMEAAKGKPIVGMDIETTQKFLKHDRKVLRFYCQWSDEKIYGEKRPYVLHYFLADDTVEVNEVPQQNSGRDPFPSLLRRQRLPKDHAETTNNLSRIGFTSDAKVRYYGPEDFRVGATVNVYTRPLFICGADQFTMEWYVQNMGLSPEDFPRLNMEEAKEELGTIAPPEHNGFGSEEDSLGSFLYLMPRPPKPDFKKLMENDGMHMRFLGQFVNPKPEDRNRRFIITYYLANDTVSVFEKFERNSGFVGGKFLERQRFKNPATGEFYAAPDFRSGAQVTINKFAFQLLEADEYTVKFMDNNPELFGEGSAYYEAGAAAAAAAGPTSPSGAVSPSGASRGVGRTGPGGSVLSSAGRRVAGQ